MKKSGLLFLLAVVVPFLSGCGSNGLWSWNSSGVEGTPTSPITAISPKIVVTKTTLSAASIRSAIDTSAAQVSVVLNDASATAVPFNLDNDSGKAMTYVAPSLISVSNLAKNSTGEKYSMDVRFLVNGQKWKVKVEFPTLLGGTTSAATTTEVIVSVSFAVNVYGEITTTYSLGYIPYGATSPLVTSNSTSSSKNSLPEMYIDKVVSLIGTKETLLGPGEIAGVPHDTTVFKFYFNHPIKALPATYSMEATGGGATHKFLSTANQATVATDTTGKIITLTLTASGSIDMAASTPYSIVFKSAPITASGSTYFTTLAPGTTYYIRTN